MPIKKFLRPNLLILNKTLYRRQTVKPTGRESPQPLPTPTIRTSSNTLLCPDHYQTSHKNLSSSAAPDAPDKKKATHRETTDQHPRAVKLRLRHEGTESVGEEGMRSSPTHRKRRKPTLSNSQVSTGPTALEATSLCNCLTILGCRCSTHADLTMKMTIQNLSLRVMKQEPCINPSQPEQFDQKKDFSCRRLVTSRYRM